MVIMSRGFDFVKEVYEKQHLLLGNVLNIDENDKCVAVGGRFPSEVSSVASFTKLSELRMCL